jgi:hypothetical protein
LTKVKESGKIILPLEDAACWKTAGCFFCLYFRSFANKNYGNSSFAAALLRRMERSKESFRGGEPFLRRPCAFSLVLLLQQLTIDDFCIWAVAARPHLQLVSYAPGGRRVELIGKTAKFATDLTSGVRNDYKDTVDNTMWILNQLADGREF